MNDLPVSKFRASRKEVEIYMDSDDTQRSGTLMRVLLFFPLLQNILQKEDVILDAGGFDGVISSYLQKINHVKSYVLDLDFQGLVSAKNKDVGVVSGSITDIPVMQSAFDGALSFDSIEHIVEDVAAIEEIARVLKPNGWLFLSTTADNFRLPFLSKNWITRNWQHVRVGYSYSELEALLNSAGLEIETSGRYNNFWTRLFYVVLFYFRLPPFFPKLRLEIFKKVLEIETICQYRALEHWVIARKK